MRKILLLTLLAASLSCTRDKGGENGPATLSVTPSAAVAFTANADETYLFKVETNRKSWKVEVTPAAAAEWCRADKTEEGFTLSASVNFEESAPAEATVTVTAGDAVPVSFIATQAAHTSSDAFAGYIIRNGVAQKIARAGSYCYGTGYELLISQYDIEGKEVYESPAGFEISIPVEMLGRKVDMSKDAVDDEAWEWWFAVDEWRNPLQCLQHRAYRTDGTVMASFGEEGYCDFELEGMKTLDGTILSCRGRGKTEVYDSYNNWSVTVYGSSDFVITNEVDVEVHTGAFPKVRYDIYPRGFDSDLGLYETDLYLDCPREDITMNMHLNIYHSEPMLTPGAYTFADTPADGIITYNYLNTTVGQSTNGTITGGAIVLDLSGDCFSVELKDIVLDNPGMNITGKFSYDPEAGIEGE